VGANSITPMAGKQDDKQEGKAAVYAKHNDAKIHHDLSA